MQLTINKECKGEECEVWPGGVSGLSGADNGRVNSAIYRCDLATVINTIGIYSAKYRVIHIQS